MVKPHPIFDHITRGAAEALLQFSLIACSDSDVERFFFDHLPLWQALDAELTHPTETTYAQSH